MSENETEKYEDCKGKMSLEIMVCSREMEIYGSIVGLE